jgi:sorting nexin-1/2
MLNKAAAHPTLQHDGDLKLFLESESFNVDIKHKERKEPLVGESKGMFSSIGIGASAGKFVEHDDWFHDRRIYLDALENQLKALQKATDTVVVQRKSLAEACGDFSASLQSLATVELSPQLSGPLQGLSDLQIRIRELYDRQAQQDVLTLGIVIDEYIRMIGSCKMAFSMRQKSYHAWNAAESDLGKRKSMQDKLLRQGRSQQDRLNQLSAEVADSEKKAHQARLLFEDMGRILRQELDRFEKEKVEEFKSGVETYLESAVEAQKEVCSLPFAIVVDTILTTFLSSSLKSGKLISCVLILKTMLLLLSTRVLRELCLNKRNHPLLVKGRIVRVRTVVINMLHPSRPSRKRTTTKIVACFGV